MTSENFRTLYIYDTIYCADTVEWCPISPYKTSFACGNYQTQDNGESAKTCSRIGGISIFTISENGLEKNFNITSSAVLDLKWCRKKINDKILLAAANSVGEVIVFHFENKIIKVLSKYSLKKIDEDFLALSIDWTKQGFEDLICSSDSKGNISVLKVENDVLILLREWNAHSLEAWVVCFDSFQPNIIYSGGDEGLLKVWDKRNYKYNNELYSSNLHTAGVTALNSNLHKEFNLISGSYDENIFIWDTRNWKRPVKTLSASGGVWRLKWEPKSRSRYFLAACIYGGFQMYDAIDYKVVGEYKEHESLAYGADWCSLDCNEVSDILGCEPAHLIATCSFYDHKLCISSWEEKTESMK